MAKPKSNKTVKSINFDDDVLQQLEIRCKIEKMDVSAFVNEVIKRAVMSEFEFYRQKAKYHNAEFQKYRMLMETSPDNPTQKTTGDKYDNR